MGELSSSERNKKSVSVFGISTEHMHYADNANGNNDLVL